MSGRQYGHLLSRSHRCQCFAHCAIGQDLRRTCTVSPERVRQVSYAHSWASLQELKIVELFSNAWWSALLAIVLIDLVLAGDNAIVIALAARNVPDHLRKKTILWGTAGAVVVRIVMTLGVVWLLQIPGLLLVGGLGLVWVAYKLLADQSEGVHEEGGVHTFWGAMKTIMVADALMGIDNVLGVAGAAHGAMDLVVIGLLISVPIVVFGSSVVLRLVERFPWIIGLGAAVLALTAAQMMANEPWLQDFFGAAKGVIDERQQWSRWGLYALVTAGVLLAGWRSQRRALQVADPA